MNQHIVVGIDESASSAKALRWAAAEAQRRKLPLLIARAYDILGGGALSKSTLQLVVREVANHGQSLLCAASAEVALANPRVQVLTHHSGGRAGDLLVTLSRTAAVIALGTQGQSRVANPSLGSVSQRIAAQAHCPVVLIDQDVVLDEHRRIVVGVAADAGGREALRFAFREAAERHATLVAVRAQGVGANAAEPDPPQASPRRRGGAARILHNCVSAVQTDFPDVSVEQRVLDQPVHEALPLVARDADLLVMGRRRHDRRWPSGVGGVAATVLHRSPCPVVVVASRATALATASDPGHLTAS